MIIRKHDLLNSKTEFDSDIPNFLDMLILILKDQVRKIKMVSPNSWLDVARASPPDPSAPAGSLSHPPLLPDPPDPILFPPLPASKSPLPLKLSSPHHSLPPKPSTNPSSATSYLPVSPSPQPPPPLNLTTTAHLLASFSSSLLSNCSQNPRSTSTTVIFPTAEAPIVQGTGLLGVGPADTTIPPLLPDPGNPLRNLTGIELQHNKHSLPKVPVNKPTTLAAKAKANTDRTLRRLSPQTFSPTGVPRVVIPDEVYQKGAELHKEFLVCRFSVELQPTSLSRMSLITCGEKDDTWRFTWFQRQNQF